MLETVSQYSPSTDLVNFLQGKTNMKIGMLSVIVLVLQHFFHFVKPRGAIFFCTHNMENVTAVVGSNGGPPISLS